MNSSTITLCKDTACSGRPLYSLPLALIPTACAANGKCNMRPRSLHSRGGASSHQGSGTKVTTRACQLLAGRLHCIVNDSFVTTLNSCQWHSAASSGQWPAVPVGGWELEWPRDWRPVVRSVSIGSTSVLFVSFSASHTVTVRHGTIMQHGGPCGRGGAAEECTVRRTRYRYYCTTFSTRVPCTPCIYEPDGGVRVPVLEYYYL